METVAIVIPAYNAAESLPKTLDSVLVQTYGNIEVWVTNDGSKDGTGQVADDYAKRDSRVRVIHQENCGCYQARLHALQKINAPYFTFVDADDTVEPTWIARMVSALEEHDLDAVECRQYGEKACDDTIRVIEADEMPQYRYDYLVNSRVGCFVWNKLYRNQFDFSEFEKTDKVTNYEDLIFNLQFFRKIKRLGLLNSGLYHYEMVETSAVHTIGPRQKHDFKWMVANHYRLSRALFPGGEFTPFRIWIGHCKWLLRNYKNALVGRIRSLLA